MKRGSSVLEVPMSRPAAATLAPSVERRICEQQTNIVARVVWGYIGSMCSVGII